MLFGCATTPQVIEKEVFVRCPIPDVPKAEKPVIKQDMTYPEKLKTLLDYMFKLERENELLRSILDACR
ncbi:hypothetical protein [uncultured virus]|uniref:Uncharacterized protein n=1 Tax=uncultured virus TaxID=340016 RepID=A0A5Q0TWE6_9VIRU|nr:hypothetical protein [uncultured virus]